MSFSIVNNSALAVITSINTQTSTDGSFTVTSGSFPLFSGQTVSGTNTTIQDRNGADQATVLLFLQQGNAQINLYVNGNLISAKDYSSGIIEIKTPILLSSDVLSMQVDETEEPVPSPTPTTTPTNTPTPSTTAAVTPTPTNTGTPTNTPTNTNTPTPSSTSTGSPYILSRAYFYGVSGNISGITGTITANGVQMTKSGTSTSDTVEFKLANFPYQSTASTLNLVLSANPVGSGSYIFQDDGSAGATYDRITLTGFTYFNPGDPNTERFSGTTKFWTGDTQIGYTENGNVILQKATKDYQIGGAYNTGFFNIAVV